MLTDLVVFYSEIELCCIYIYVFTTAYSLRPLGVFKSIKYGAEFLDRISAAPRMIMKG
jgi:hypothetical protein